MPDSLPKFSIVIPTYNRRLPLGECLRSLAALEYPTDRFEVLVVDDESPRSPEDIVAPYRDKIAIKLLVQPHGGPARARNAGALAATGEYVAFTDDDCAPAPDWLRRLADRFLEHRGCAIGGHTINRLPRNPYSTASQLLVDYLYAYFVQKKGRFFTSNNLAVPLDRFREIGGFNPDMPLAAAEDREFCVRWAARGYPLVEAPEAVVEHAHALDFRAFCRQHFNYGRGAYYYHRLVASQAGEAIRVEPIRFYSDLVRYPLRKKEGKQAFGLSLLMAVSQAANVSGFVYERLWPCHSLDTSAMK